ncbi:uncharacterized protein LOC135691399 [Rhopilema esculentum]|uniref:uncharacterized protein LOC135691399 n=1 Tax=Rhopilema esculentum TaxID=499914 RepID=UPI0031E1573D
MGDVCSKCFGYLNGIERHAFEPGKFEARRSGNENEVSVLSIRHRGEDGDTTNVRYETRNNSMDSRNQENSVCKSIENQYESKEKSPALQRKSNKGVIIILSTPEGEQICKFDNNVEGEGVYGDSGRKYFDEKENADSNMIENETERKTSSSQTEDEMNRNEANKTEEVCALSDFECGEPICTESVCVNGTVAFQTALGRFSDFYTRSIMKMAISDLTRSLKSFEAVTRETKHGPRTNEEGDTNSAAEGNYVVSLKIINFAADLVKAIISASISRKEFKSKAYFDHKKVCCGTRTVASAMPSDDLPHDCVNKYTIYNETTNKHDAVSLNKTQVVPLCHHGLEQNYVKESHDDKSLQRSNPAQNMGKPILENLKLNATLANTNKHHASVEDQLVEILVQKAIQAAIWETNKNEVANRKEAVTCIDVSSTEDSLNYTHSSVDLNYNLKDDKQISVNSNADMRQNELSINMLPCLEIHEYHYPSSNSKEISTHKIFPNRVSRLKKYGHQMSSRIIIEAIASILTRNLPIST